MTPQEIIKEIYKLPIMEQKEVLDSLESEDIRVQKSLANTGAFARNKTASPTPNRRFSGNKNQGRTRF